MGEEGVDHLDLLGGGGVRPDGFDFFFFVGGEVPGEWGVGGTVFEDGVLNFDDEHAAEGIAFGGENLVEPGEQSGHAVVVRVAAIRGVQLGMEGCAIRWARGTKRLRVKAKSAASRERERSFICQGKNGARGGVKTRRSLVEGCPGCSTGLSWA